MTLALYNYIITAHTNVILIKTKVSENRPMETTQLRRQSNPHLNVLLRDQLASLSLNP